MSQSDPTTSHGQVGFNYISSKRGRTLLMRGGYKYDKKRNNKDGSVVWRCVRRLTCKALLIITSASVIKRKDRHDCEPDFVSREFDTHFYNCQKRIVSDVTTQVPCIFRDTVGVLKDSGLNLVKGIPMFKNVKDKFYRKRNKSLGDKLLITKVCFKNLKEVIVPEKFNTFLIADYRSNNDRICNIFAYLLTKLAGAYWKTIVLTYYVMEHLNFALTLFINYNSLHVDFGSTNKYTNIAPVIFALLPNKTRKTYEIMFQLLKSQLTNWNPKSFILDYEVAAMQAITNIFPETPINGCYFHFSKSLWSKAKDLGITKLTLNRKHIKNYLISICNYNCDFMPSRI